MDNILINILYVLGGIVVGLIGTIIVYNIRGNSLQKKKESITENARKEADRMKRDSILEAKRRNA